MGKEVLVIYHANCADGFGAAFAAWKRYGDAADYVPMAYGQPAPDTTGKSVYILDFSFKKEVMRQMDEQANRIVLLDHHLSAAEDLNGFQCRCGKIHFDMEKCGARLAWEHFHPEVPLPKMFKFIEDRDLWKWENPLSAGYLSALDSESRDFSTWSKLSDQDGGEVVAFVARGQAMLDKAESYWRSIAKRARPVSLCGVPGLVVNGPQEMRDELGSHLAATSGTFGLVWAQDGEQVKVSLRANASFEVLELAKKMGGGGHPAAASFYLPANKVPALMAGTVD